MKILDSIRDRVSGLLIGGDAIQLQIKQSQEAINELYERAELNEMEAQSLAIELKAKESIADLELSLDDVGWRDLDGVGSTQLWNFSRAAISKMVKLSRLMYIANPLMRRAVTVQELYVWGSGCTIKAENETVNEVLEDFFKDPKNQCVIGDNWAEREREQRIDGNTFFVFFRNRENGAIRVRLLAVDEIVQVICNPDDAKEPWFYKRSGYTDLNGVVQEARLYPDIDYNPRVKPRVYGIDYLAVEWDKPVLHVKTGGLSMMRFGMPELFSAIPWATAYKKILENFATILAAYARVAMQIKNNPGKKGIAASKAKLGTGVQGATQAVDNNPPTNTASWFLASGGVELSAVKTAHSTTGPDEARALRSMVAAGSDTPEHFFGDSDIGNFATSTTLDRPTELKMVARQNMWAGVMGRMARYVITSSASAPQGKLRGAGYTVTVYYDQFDGTAGVLITPPEGENKKFQVTFPSILERDVTDRVRSVVQAATLGGSPAEGIIKDRRLLFKLLMEALGQKDADGLTAQLYPQTLEQGFIDPADAAKNAKTEADAKKGLADAALKSADAKMKIANKPRPAASAAAAGPKVSQP